MLEKARSIAYITNEKINEATSTTTKLLCNSSQVGQLTLFKSSLLASLTYNLILFMSFICCTGGETRTPSLWFWRPSLCQLSYTRIDTEISLVAQRDFKV